MQIKVKRMDKKDRKDAESVQTLEKNVLKEDNLMDWGSVGSGSRAAGVFPRCLGKKKLPGRNVREFFAGA